MLSMMLGLKGALHSRNLQKSFRREGHMAIEMFKRGSVEMLALLILNEDDAHGYRIVQEIKDRSDGRLIIKEGSLYPILYKLSDEGYIISQEDISETKLGRKRIRVIYSITPK